MGSRSSNKNSALNFLKNINVRNRRSGPSKHEEILAEKSFLRRIYTGQQTIHECEISQSRAKFLIVFSPDGTKLACTNGNHNAYVLDVRSQKLVKTLSGHKRTPWTISFHPTDSNIVASGCLNGEVRVWNLEDDTCETWCSSEKSAIASIAFHPKVKLLVIATFKNLYFWNWSTAIMYDKVSTLSLEEKVRYVKFDSSGDKLITAIAHKYNFLCQFDAINFREVFEFVKQRDMLKDFQLIDKFLENKINGLREVRSKVLPDSNLPVTNLNNGNGPSTSNFIQNLPYMCSSHYQSFQQILNVDCFCPDEFAENVMTIFQMKSRATHYFCDKCYFCRYTWLYTGVYKFDLHSSFSSYGNVAMPMNRQSPLWKFTDVEKQELKADNEDECNGITEAILKQCFAQYAQKYVAPLFASRIPNGVCSKCFSITNFPSYSFYERYGKERKPLLRLSSDNSDNFIKMCDHFGFKPTGCFEPFLNSFADVRPYILVVKKLFRGEDYLKLDAFMTEWDYLYCKLLFINKMIEGDSELLLRKIPNGCKKEPSNRSKLSSFHRESNYFKNQNETIYGTKPSDETPDLEEIVENITKTKIHKDNDKLHNCKCRQIDVTDVNSTMKSFQMLKKELEKFSLAISSYYNPKTQRSRIEKFYQHMLNIKINDKEGTLLRILQIGKKSVMESLIIVVTELKKLLILNCWSADEKSQFQIIVLQTLLYVTRKVISLSNKLLEIIRNFNYNDGKFITDSRLPRIQLFDNSYDRSIPPSTFSHRRNAILAFSSTSEPVFNEEFYSIPSEFSEDELGSNAAESSNLGNPASYPCDSKNEIVNRLSLSPQYLKHRLNILSEKEVVACNTYLAKHIQLLDANEEDWVSDHHHFYNHFQNLKARERDLLQDIYCLIKYFRYQNEEDVRENRFHPLHRVQMWDFSKLEIPDITSTKQNVVVTECKVHNDATIAISSDDSLIAVLVSPNQFEQPDWIGIFSLQWKTLGHILCTVSPKQLPVSLSFSPTNQHLAIGYSYLYKENIKIADVIDVKREIKTWRENTEKRRPSPIITSFIDEPPPHGFDAGLTVNCIKWIPVPGQGFVFGNSAGQLKFVS